MAKALFLDRDGTINVDTGYVCERAKFTFLDGVFDFCRRAQEDGYLIIVITNQSGIARGYYTEADYERLTEWMRGEFAAHGVTVTDVFHCPALDGPDRKPAPGMFLKARDKYGLDMAASVNIGDKPRDLTAGERAGVGTNLLFTDDWRTMALPDAGAAKGSEQQAAERVSVIVPVYNVEQHLARCLDSICAQTARDLEIICVNDGSTDASAAILADYAAKDSRIRVLTQPNEGVSAARNAGLDAATGEWVMFVDSDDWIPPYAVEGFLTVAAESGARAVVSAAYAVDELSALRPAAFRWTLKRPALKNLVGRRKIQSSAWNKFYRRDMVGARRFIEGIYFEDWPFVTELFGDLDAFALVDAPLYVYCKTGTSIVRSLFTEKKVASYLTGIAHVAAHFRDHPQRRVAQRRCATAVKMLINKVCKTKNRALQSRVRRELASLRAAGAFRCRDLSFKSLVRLFALRNEA